MPADPIIPELLTEKMIRAHFLPIGARTLARWVSCGRFPKADLALGGKSRFWKKESVTAWIDAHSEGGAK
jgi:predicted DNA-binding transcriptional regulator AlpA